MISPKRGRAPGRSVVALGGTVKPRGHCQRPRQRLLKPPRPRRAAARRCKKNQMKTTGTDSGEVKKVRRRWEKGEGQGRQWLEAARRCTKNQKKTNGTDSGEVREVLRQWEKGGGEGQRLSVAATVTAAPPGQTATGTNTG